MKEAMRNNQAGVAIVEFALVLPLLLILILITTEFGRALYEYNTIAKSVRNAARYLATQDPSIVTTDRAKVDAAKNLVVYGKREVTSSDAPLAPSLSVSLVPDPVWEMAGSSPSINAVTIRVTGYGFRLMVSRAFGLVLGETSGVIPFGDISATMRAQS
jgi:hypothetical protein